MEHRFGVSVGDQLRQCAQGLKQLTAVRRRAVAATAILDRLLHHSQVITTRGDTYRLPDKRRSGLLQKAAAPTPITSES